MSDRRSFDRLREERNNERRSGNPERLREFRRNHRFLENGENTAPANLLWKRPRKSQIAPALGETAQQRSDRHTSDITKLDKENTHKSEAIEKEYINGKNNIRRHKNYDKNLANLQKKRGMAFIELSKASRKRHDNMLEKHAFETSLDALFQENNEE